MSEAMRLVGIDEPLMVAWRRFKQTEEFENAYKHSRSMLDQPINGALWAMFMAGFVAATELAAAQHESVNAASDEERQSHTPGAGAMGAVIEYRDLIRKSLP